MTMPPRNEPTFPHDPQMSILSGWFLILLALPIAVWITLRIVDNIDSRSWPKARAEIVSSELYKRTSRSSTDWCIKLSYRYTIDGKQYTSRRISTSRISGANCDTSEAVMRSRLERQRPGDPIAIRYRPGQPAYAIVYIGKTDATDFLFPGLAIALFGGGVASIRAAGPLRQQQAAHAAERRERMARAGEQRRQRV